MPLQRLVILRRLLYSKRKLHSLVMIMQNRDVLPRAARMMMMVTGTDCMQELGTTMEAAPRVAL